jgi:hypothetical protein
MKLRLDGAAMSEDREDINRIFRKITELDTEKQIARSMTGVEKMSDLALWRSQQSHKQKKGTTYSITARDMGALTTLRNVVPHKKERKIIHLDDLVLCQGPMWHQQALRREQQEQLGRND